MASAKQVIELTEAAAFQVKEMMVHNEEQGSFLRVSVKGGGCSGLSYGMNFEKQQNENDYTDEQHGLTIIVASEDGFQSVSAFIRSLIEEKATPDGSSD